MKLRGIFFTALAIFAAGVALIVMHQSISSGGIVIAGGILFIVVGLINMALLLSERREAAETQKSVMTTVFNWASSGAAVVLGLSMLIFKESFVTMVPRIAGIIVILCALYQLFIIGYSPRSARLSNWLYIVPGTMIVDAVYIFTLSGYDDDARIMLLTGCAFALFGLATFFETFMLARYYRKLLKQEKSEEELTSLPNPNSHADSKSSDSADA